MILFVGSASQDLGQEISSRLNIPLGKYEHHVFSDGEQRIKLNEEVLDQDVVIIQSTGIPTDVNFIELFFMLDAAKRSGARKITCVIPYLGYSRQDHVFRTGEARSLEVVIRMLEEAGADEFVCFDLHSVKIPEIFKKPIIHLSALPLFASKIKELGLLTNEVSLVSPDMGGLRRLEILSEMLSGMKMISVEKNRDLDTGSINASIIHGDVTRTSIIVDDMIASGKTIDQAIEMLRSKGSKSIFVFATHPIFSEDASYLLQAGNGDKVFVTNSIEVDKDKRFDKLEVLSIADLIVGVLQK